MLLHPLEQQFDVPIVCGTATLSVAAGNLKMIGGENVSPLPVSSIDVSNQSQRPGRRIVLGCWALQSNEPITQGMAARAERREEI